MKKLWLDDLRQEPEGWIRAKTASQAIMLLATGAFGEVSLDHDLGHDLAGDGYQVISWLEEQIEEDPSFYIPIIKIHTSNPGARIKMSLAAKNIEKIKNDRSIQF